VLLTLAGVAFGRRRTAFDGNHLWIHNSIRWTDPIELTQVLGAHYQFVPRQGPILILVTEHVGTKVLLKPSWMKDVPTPAGMRRVGIALRGIDADALLASLAPALLSGRASIDDNTRNHLLGATARTRAQTS
jgi:hypothetical protein